MLRVRIDSEQIKMLRSPIRECHTVQTHTMPTFFFIL